jgi:outer membrane murein-binding lipoprotein Lpp
MGSLLKSKNAPFANVVGVCAEHVGELLASSEGQLILPYLGGKLPTNDRGNACMATLGRVEGDEFLVVKSPLPATMEIRPGVSVDPQTALFAIVGATAVLAGQGQAPKFDDLSDDVLKIVAQLGEFQQFSQAKVLAEAMAGQGYNIVAALNGTFIYFAYYGDLPRDESAMRAGCAVGMWYFNHSKALLNKASQV